MELAEVAASCAAWPTGRSSSRPRRPTRLLARNRSMDATNAWSIRTAVSLASVLCSGGFAELQALAGKRLTHLSLHVQRTRRTTGVGVWRSGTDLAATRLGAPRIELRRTTQAAVIAVLDRRRTLKWM